MTAEQLEELLGKVEDQLSRKGLILPTDEMAQLQMMAFDLARRAIAAEKLVEAGQAICDRWDTSDWGGSLVNTRHTIEFIAELRRAATAYREACK